MKSCNDLLVWIPVIALLGLNVVDQHEINKLKQIQWDTSIYLIHKDPTASFNNVDSRVEVEHQEGFWKIYTVSSNGWTVSSTPDTYTIVTNLYKK